MLKATGEQSLPICFGGTDPRAWYLGQRACRPALIDFAFSKLLEAGRWGGASRRSGRQGCATDQPPPFLGLPRDCREPGPADGCGLKRRDWLELLALGPLGGPGLQKLFRDPLGGSKKKKKKKLNSSCWSCPSRGLTRISITPCRLVRQIDKPAIVIFVGERDSQPLLPGVGMRGEL